jgi:hypothetical protein
VADSVAIAWRASNVLTVPIVHDAHRVATSLWVLKGVPCAALRAQPSIAPLVSARCGADGGTTWRVNNRIAGHLLAPRTVGRRDKVASVVPVPLAGLVRVALIHPLHGRRSAGELPDRLRRGLSGTGPSGERLGATGC